MSADERASGSSASAQTAREASAARPIYQVKADFFKTLAHPARIRALELLRDGECSVGELIPGVGIEASHLSQQLGILRRANILQARREGAAVLYSVTDPRIFELLEVARAILTTSLTESTQLLAELQVPAPEPGG
ncbi:MAG TPA: metalloregulator ArsR/SmtB family transcription factor [Streptosporangiaceae bacterium]|nr:metalloregulator ArsR/SmtB family transcription factor [Streptosporangiaceae bacterium]